MADPVNQNTCLKVDSAGGAAATADGPHRPDGTGHGLARIGGETAHGRSGHQILHLLRTGAGALATALWPARCLVCGDPGEDGRDLCGHCDRDLPWSGVACIRCALPLPAALPGEATTCTLCEHEPPPIRHTHAAFSYAVPLDRLLPQLKFHGDLATGRLCARLMAERFADLPAPDALVPVPLHGKRLRERGYNQAREIAAPLARQLGAPLRDDLLRRVRHTQAQSRLDADARQANLEDAFLVRDTRPLPAHVVLVDDVMTTGATLHAAAWALREAGVRRVDAWVVARAL